MNTRKAFSITTMLAVCLLMATTSLRAATQNWNPGGVASAGGAWDTTTANWNAALGGAVGGNVVWGQGNAATFSVGSAYVVTVNSSGITVGNLTILGTASGPMTVNQTSTGSKQLTFAANSTIDTATRTVVINGGDFIATSSSVVLTKIGTGTLSLSSMSGTFAGKWVISAGAASIGTTGTSTQWFGGNTADDAVTLDNGSIITCSAGVRTISGNGFTIAGGGGAFRAGTTTAGVTVDVKSKISGSGTMSCNTAGTTVAANCIVLDNAANAFTGTFAVNSALTKVGVAGAIPSGASVLMNSGGTSTVLDFNNVATTLKTISGSGGTVELNGATVTINNPAGEIFGANTQSTISGGNFVKNGSGAITFSIGTGSWNGGVTVNNGTLNVGTANSLGTGKLTMAGGKLASSSTGGRSYTVPVDITADSTFGDATTSGTLTFGTGAFRLVAGDRQITCASDVVLNAALANDGTIRALTKAGNSNLTLSVAATYGGNTTVSAGTLTMGAANGIPNTTLNMSGGTLAMGANNCNINALQFSGVSKAAGTWGSLTSAANHKNSRFTGAGVLTVATGGTSTTSVSSDGSPSTYGSPVTFTVTVTGTGNGSTPSGNVTILDNGTPIATPALSGSGNVATATFGTSTLAAGTHANITATWAGDDNYDLSSSSAFSQTVNPRPVTLSGTRAYDGTTDAAASILSIGNKVGVDDVTVASGTATLASADVGSRAITSVGTLALGGANAGNYTLSGASGSVSITAKALSITANNQTKIKGNAFLFNGTEFTTSGLVSPETIGSVTLISAGADTGADAGTYSIVPTAATGGTFNPGNYSVTYHNGTMTVNDPAHITSSPSSSTINAGNSVVLSVTT
ncbi:MAG: beta strand repeat-containing protein, partial [Limisphaerales bacterium]